MCVKDPILAACSFAGYLTAVVVVVTQGCSSMYGSLCMQLKSSQPLHVTAV